MPRVRSDEIGADGDDPHHLHHHHHQHPHEPLADRSPSPLGAGLPLLQRLLLLKEKQVGCGICTALTYVLDTELYVGGHLFGGAGPEA